MTVTTVAAGSGRGGSTLVSQLLGANPGFVNVGELRQLWTHHERGYRCSCGERVAECPFWSNVCSSVSSAVEIETSQWIRLFAGISHKRWRIRSADRAVVQDSLRLLVAHLKAATGATSIVDSSKMPGFLAALASATPTDFVHLVRDSRAVAFSWKNPKIKSYAHNSEMRTRNVATSAVLWSSRHVAQEWVGNRHGKGWVRVKYEDLCLDPTGEMDRIWSALDRNISTTTQSTHPAAHALAGNPGRFGKPVDEIKLDEAWRTALGSPERIAVELLSWPLLWRYGYLNPPRFAR